MATLQPPNIFASIYHSQGGLNTSSPFSETDRYHPFKSSRPADQENISLGPVLDSEFVPVDVQQLGGCIFVRDPPVGLVGQAQLVKTSIPVPTVFPALATPTLSLTPDAVSPSTFYPIHTNSRDPPSLATFTIKMAKKRRSLQSILVPSFLHSPPPSLLPTPPTHVSRTRSPSSESELIYHPPLETDSNSRATSSRNSPPPFLLDDDPFANLASPALHSSADTSRPPRPSASAPTSPRSPLSPSATEPAKRLSPPSRSSPATMSIFPRSHLVHPAHKRPAFAPRPSLPSLHTLARMNAHVMLPRKVRKGKVGARLPFEPWDLQGGVPSTTENSGAISGPSMSIAASTSNDFTSDLDADFLDLTEDDDYDDEDYDDPIIETQHFVINNNDETLFERRPAHSESLSNDDDSEHSRLSPPNAQISSAQDFPPSLSRSSSTSVSSPSSCSDVDESEDPLALSDYQTRYDGSQRSDDSQHSTSTQPHSSSAESDSDIPDSPPDDNYFVFPRSSSPDFLLADTDRDDEHVDDVGCEPPEGMDMPFRELGVDHTPHHSIYFNRSNSLGMGNSESVFEPGSSAGTIRGSSVHAWALSRNRRYSSKWMREDNNGEMYDGAEWQSGQSGYYSSHGYGNQGGNSGFGSSSGRGNGTYGGHSNNNWGNSGGNGGDDGEDRRGRRGREGFGYQYSSESEKESDSEDDYGVPSASQSKNAVPEDYSASDDDVPLAQRIPTALKAQKTIRRKVKEERDQRRRERAAKATLNGEVHRAPLTPNNPSQQYAMPSSQEAALQASRPAGRKRTMTMPSNASRPFVVEELTKKLESVQVPDVPLHSARSKSRSRRPSPDQDPPLAQLSNMLLRSKSRSRHVSPDRDPLPPPPIPNGQPFQETIKTLRPMRSFHRKETLPMVEHSLPLPIPTDAGQRLARSKTDARSRRREEPSVDHGAKSKSLNMQGADTSHIDQLMRGRKLVDGQGVNHLAVKREPSRSARPSMERDAYPTPRKSLQRHTPSPVPPLPIPDAKNQVITQQRIFVGDMQSFNTVEISASTTAQDVLDIIKVQGQLKQFIGSGGWMVFEVAQDFGMERPIRSFELLADVQASWNKDKMVNMFVVKMSPLSPLLSRSSIPSSSPMHSGWVEWEAKRGKWSKRWMQLREHSLWLSKRDSGKDEVFLCSLSNFDAYTVTRIHKAPKPYVFAVKSTDNLSFFENTADYLHVFSCSQKDGEKWLEVILLARSYVLYQEKNVLFNPKAASSLSGATTLSRSGTRKTSASRPTQPLVDVTSPDVFAPGSLLYRKS